MKKSIKLILAGTALSGAALLFISAAAAPLEAELQSLEPVTAQVTFTEQGNYIYKSSMEVSPNLTGSVQEVLVKEGDRVKKGDPIATISAEDVAYQIQRLESDIKSYNAQIYNLALSEQKERDSLLGTKNDLLGQLTSLDSQVQTQQSSEESREAQIAYQEDIVAQDRASVRIARDDLRTYRDDNSSDTGDFEYNQYRQALATAEKALAASEQRLLELQGATTDEGYYQGRQESLNAQIAAIDGQMGKSYNSALQSYYYALVESAQVSIAELTEKQGKATVTAPCDGIISDLPVTEMAWASQGTVIAAIGTEPMVEVFVPKRP